MTKADIVNNIAKQTGAEKVLVQEIVEAFMENVKGSLIENDQGACSEGCSQHLEGYHHHHPCSQHPRFQARKELRWQGKIRD